MPCYNENNARLEGCFAKSSTRAQPHIAPNNCIITATINKVAFITGTDSNFKKRKKEKKHWIL